MTRLTVNNEAIQYRLPPDTPLLWALREDMKLLGTKFGCGAGLCGACTVMMDGDAIRAAAEAAGLSYTAIPVTHAGFSFPQVQAMIAALEDAGGPVLAYCRSGTRSCNLWALAGAGLGEDPDTLTAKAAGAGYDISGLRPLMDAVAQRQG